MKLSLLNYFPYDSDSYQYKILVSSDRIIARITKNEIQTKLTLTLESILMFLHSNPNGVQNIFFSPTDIRFNMGVYSTKIIYDGTNLIGIPFI